MENTVSYAAEILLLVFLAVVFLQSGIDKITDWGGNLSWLKSHFAETPLKSIVPVMLSIVLLAEMASGALCSMGIYQIAVLGKTSIAFYGALVSCLSLLMLLFGQRVAKDYDGARTIVVYFIPAVFLVFLLQS